MTCQWCKSEIRLKPGEVVRHYGGKVYHFACWKALNEMARRVGGIL